MEGGGEGGGGGLVELVDCEVLEGEREVGGAEGELDNGERDSYGDCYDNGNGNCGGDDFTFAFIVAWIVLFTVPHDREKER